MQALNDRVILVTGATDGLGKRVAQDFAERGATVLLHGRNSERGGTVLRKIRNATGNDGHRYYNADFAYDEQARQRLWQLSERLTGSD